MVAQVNPDGSKLFILGDQKGSSTVVTNQSGNVIENTSYSPYGEVLTGGTKTRYGYEGKEQNSILKNIDFRARQYCAEYGIFCQPDSILPNVYDPQQLNRYMFERGNPYKNTDPSGRSATPFHYYGAKKALIGLGYNNKFAQDAGNFAQIPDLVPYLNNEKQINFYETFGGNYLNYHLDPGMSAEQKEDILKWNAEKFVELAQKGDPAAGVYLHVFGDVFHQGGPQGGKQGTWFSKMEHGFLDARFSNIQMTYENILLYISNAMNNVGWRPSGRESGLGGGFVSGDASVGEITNIPLESYSTILNSAK